MAEPILNSLEVTSAYYETLKRKTEKAVSPLQGGVYHDGVMVSVNPILPDGFELWRWSDGLSELYRQSDGALVWRDTSPTPESPHG